MSKFQQLTTEDFMETKGGKINHANPWQIFNSKTHKCWADNAAIARTCGRVIVNGWLQHGPWGARQFFIFK